MVIFLVTILRYVSLGSNKTFERDGGRTVRATAVTKRAREATSGAKSDTRACGNAGFTSPEAQLAYVADMLLELKTLAERAGKPALGRLLDVAASEARGSAA